MFFGPNINKMKEKRDIDGLGRLLQHKNDRIKQESYSALLELLKSPELRQDEVVSVLGLLNPLVQGYRGQESTNSLYAQILGQLLRHKNTEIQKTGTKALLAIFRKTYRFDYTQGNDLRLLIASLFRGVNSDVLSFLIQDIKENLSSDYDDDIYAIALYAGGLDELIKLHMQIAEDPKTRYTKIHYHISNVVLYGAGTNKVSLRVLLDIIPYGFGEISAGELTPLFDGRSADISGVTKEMCQEAIKRLNALPYENRYAHSGLNHCSPEAHGRGTMAMYAVVGERLLKRLKSLLIELSK